MSQQDLQQTLSDLSGHLALNTPNDMANFDSLKEKLTETVFDASVPLKKASFSYERSDFLAKDKILPERLKQIQMIADKIGTRQKDPEYRMFTREVPMITAQIEGSVPGWAVGAAIDKTIGPFINNDGNKIWFDFYKIEKLVALYIQGNPEPAILFNVSTLRRFLSFNLPLITDLLHTYKLLPGSVWINSKIFAQTAPSGFYAGLKIKGGEIVLSAAPQLINNQLTIAPNILAKVRLDLDQPSPKDADDTSKYGLDAREMALKLPTQFSFQFSGNNRQINSADAAKWTVLGDERSFEWAQGSIPVYRTDIKRIVIPYKSSPGEFIVNNSKSDFNKTQGKATILESGWALPVASINISQPPPAEGIGGMMISCKDGLSTNWKGLQGGEIKLIKPTLLVDPGTFSFTDPNAGNNIYSRQQFSLWQDSANPFPSTIKVLYPKSFPFIYFSHVNGTEYVSAKVNSIPQLDRPVTVTGNALDIQSKDSMIIIFASKLFSGLSLFDDNIIQDNYNPNDKNTYPKPIALALQNAVFTTTNVNGLILIGTLNDDFVQINSGTIFLTFGVYSYLPILPDPYTANLGLLKNQFIRTNPLTGAAEVATGIRSIRLWLFCQVKWTENPPEQNDNVDVRFYFAPIQNNQNIALSGTVNTPFNTKISDRMEQFLQVSAPVQTTSNSSGQDLEAIVKLKGAGSSRLAMVSQRQDLEKAWDDAFRIFTTEAFALLDVSSNANQFGVSFSSFGGGRSNLMATHAAVDVNQPAQNTAFPLQVEGMDVVCRGQFAKVFTLPQISWEPVINLTDPNVINPSNPGIEPPYGPNYYPNDGGPTRIFNNSVEMVPLAPIPLTDHIIDRFANEKGNTVVSLFTLPFGMKSIAVLNKDTDAVPPKISNNRFNFPNNVKGGIQLRFTAGMLSSDRFPLFRGGTLQLNNILNINGAKTYTGTLGDSVSTIFNLEFVPKLNNLLTSRGVPLTRIDFSGYGSSIFSDWYNPDAQFAQTSQAKFDVFVGRTAHEVIQVRSMIYPWGIKVVRTIVLYRSGSGYVYRVDTGWKAESDGIYDFTYRLNGRPTTATQDVYNTHPGIVKGLFNIENITEQGNQIPLPNFIAPNQYYVDANNNVIQNGANPLSLPAIVKEVEFDCAVEIEGVEQGASDGRVPSKKMRGFVQLAPMGTPLSKDSLAALHTLQGGSIGGPLDCIIDIGNNGQKMRIHRVDSNLSSNAAGNEPLFVAASRGNVILPKDGAWSLISHEYSSGEVTPLPADTSVPVIRISQLKANVFHDLAAPEKDTHTLIFQPDPATQLLRIAHPLELLRNETNGTINFGFLQSTDTQKILFLTPSYKKLAVATEVAKLLSKTPALFADSYKMMSSKAIFPNIGNAVTSFGDAIPLATNFAKSTLTDAGKQVWELMQINQKDIAGKIEKEGYKLLKQVEDFEFPLPDKWYLINEDFLKIYVDYKKQNKGKPSVPGGLKYDINSFASNVADNWKSKLSNISMVLDMGPFERLMTIKGNFDAKNGEEAGYKGSDTDPDFPAPQIEFSPVLQTVMDILQILQDLQGAKYGDALKKGLKIAMSNNADSWEYKFEASKEIPVVKFPVPESVYNAPTTPLKLEAGMKFGVYFNGAIMVTTDPGKLIPTAGAFIDFYGRLSVMCFSLAAASIYAIGQVNLTIAADTKKGPSLKMKFGFGAQIVVGLPVVANVSILYVVGVEIYADSNEVIVTASLLFQGHADILGGIVGITITIEAKGSVKRIGDRTDCSAQVTFAIEISIFLVIDINFSESWEENRQIA